MLLLQRFDQFAYSNFNNIKSKPDYPQSILEIVKLSRDSQRELEIDYF